QEPFDSLNPEYSEDSYSTETKKHSWALPIAIFGILVLLAVLFMVFLGAFSAARKPTPKPIVADPPLRPEVPTRPKPAITGQQFPENSPGKEEPAPQQEKRKDKPSPPPRIGTETALGSSSNPSELGQPISFEAIVKSNDDTPDGHVQFNIDGKNFGAPVVLA